MLSDTLRLIAAELKLHKATGAYLDAETISVFSSVIERVAGEIAIVEMVGMDDAPPQLTREHLESGKVVLFPIARRPDPGGTA
jgi:hypothetical protein